MTKALTVQRPKAAPPGKPLTMAAFGARGTGKTAWVKGEINASGIDRKATWDFKHDPSLKDLGTPYTSLPALIQAMKAPRFNVRYLVNHERDVIEQFELYCMACYLAGCLLMYVAELPEVTKSNKAPPAWRRCVNVGRDYEVNGVRKWLAIVADAQRPAECDKSFISNADVIHTGRLSHAGDARGLADSLGVDYRELLQLPDLHWIEKDARNIEPTRGVLTFPGGKVKKKLLPAPVRQLPLRNRS